MKSRRRAYGPVIVGALGLLVLLVAAAVQVVREYREIEREILTSAQDHARLVAEHVERTTEAVTIVLQQAARRHPRPDWTALQRSRRAWRGLVKDAQQLPQVRSIWMADQNGRMRLFSGRFPTPELDVFDRDYFQAHGQGTPQRLFVGKPRPGKYTGKSFFSVSYPLVAARYNFNGVVAAAMEPAYYLPVISAFDGRCPTCRVLLLRREGDVLLTAGGGADSNVEVPTDTLSRIVRESDGVATLRLGTDWAASVARQGDAPIMAAVLVPRGAVVAAWWDRVLPIVVTAVAAALIGGLALVRAAGGARDLKRSHDRLADYAIELEAAKDEERRLRHQAAEANRAKSQFLAMMSHELRTPLNSILGFGELIAGARQDPRLRERAPDYAEDIVSSGRHLLEVLNDILDLSRIEAGRFELHAEAMNLDETVRSAAKLVGLRLANAGVALETLPSGIALHADPRAIKQILVNLLGNAAKFAPQGQVRVTAARTEDGVAIAVSDTGVGMDAAGLERALEPFGQANRGHARTAEGTGLGLNIVRELARLHGGEMRVDTAPGEGTTVTIHLPADRVLDDAGPAAASAGAPLRATA